MPLTKLLNPLLLLLLLLLFSWAIIGASFTVAIAALSLAVTAFVVNGALCLSRTMHHGGESPLMPAVWALCFFCLGCGLFVQMRAATPDVKAVFEGPVEWEAPAVLAQPALGAWAQELAGAAARGDAALPALLASPHFQPEAEPARAALHLAIEYAMLDSLRTLLQQGVSPQASWRASLPLALAVRLGWREGIELLVAAGAPIDELDESDNTPLMHACINNDISTVKLMLRLGASPSIPNADGQCAADFATHAAILKLLETP